MIDISSIIEWFKTAKPNPTKQDLIKQVAFHFEEFAEMCNALGLHGLEDKVKYEMKNLLKVSQDEDESAHWWEDVKTLPLLDSLADQTVTAIGVGVYMGADFRGALAEVNRSNYTKFTTDEKGNPAPYITPNGKIGKNPETYQEPQLEQFIGDQK